MPRIALCMAPLMLLATAALARGGHKKADDAQPVEKFYSQGTLLLLTNNLPAAMKDFQKADKISHHAYYACYLGMAEVRRRMGDLSGALHEDNRALKVAGSNTQEMANGLLIRGVLLSQMANGSKDKKLRRAAADFRKALQFDPSLIDANFDLGVVRLRQSEWPKARRS